MSSGTSQFNFDAHLAPSEEEESEFDFDSDLEEDFDDTWAHYGHKKNTKRTLDFKDETSDDADDSEFLPTLVDSSSSESESDSDLESSDEDHGDSSESSDGDGDSNDRTATIRRKVKPSGIERSPDKKRRQAVTRSEQCHEAQYSDMEAAADMCTELSSAEIEQKYNVQLQPDGEFHMIESDFKSVSDSLTDVQVDLEPAPVKRALPGPVSLVTATRFWVRSGDQYVIGGPNCSKQDVISVTCAPYKARGQNVNIDRFQVRTHTHARTHTHTLTRTHTHFPGAW